MKKNSLIIIPCAGKGTRMNMPTNKSKELLPDPYNDNKPLIEWTLDLVKNYDKVFITRDEKDDLIEYICDRNEFISLVKETEEWPATVLESRIHWPENNILILPDTRWVPKDIINEINKRLNNGDDFVFAIHKVDDISKWGFILLEDVTRKCIHTIEKPKTRKQESGYAWGLIGFKDYCGEDLFKTYLKRGSFFDLSQYQCSIIELESFKDITRTGVIESY